MLVVCNITRVRVNEFVRASVGMCTALLVALLIITYVPWFSLALTR
ncbi:MAG: hypothetical protein Q4G36_10370 [Paracoccus sp. (in: a-proteobacteria)]|nr:hypothetical protein [Paracoccus sp. (in: a-proteobacteria)]